MYLEEYSLNALDVFIQLGGLLPAMAIRYQDTGTREYLDVYARAIMIR